MSHVTVLCRHEAAPAQVEVVGEGGRPEPVDPLAPASTHVRWCTCHSTQPRVSSSHVSALATCHLYLPSLSLLKRLMVSLRWCWPPSRWSGGSSPARSSRPSCSVFSLIFSIANDDDNDDDDNDNVPADLVPPVEQLVPPLHRAPQHRRVPGPDHAARPGGRTQRQPGRVACTIKVVRALSL